MVKSSIYFNLKKMDVQSMKTKWAKQHLNYLILIINNQLLIINLVIIPLLRLALAPPELSH
jgi:hypothetical protein